MAGTKAGAAKRVYRQGVDRGGRPRLNGARPRTAFGDWMELSGMKPKEVAEALGIAVSSVYNLRNCDFKPGRELAVRIAVLSENQVPVQSW